MTETILAGLIGLLIGVGGAKALETKKPVQDTTATKQESVLCLSLLRIAELFYHV